MGRVYHRDRLGRFAPKGYSGQTSGRGARLTSKGDTGAGARMTAAAPSGVMSRSSKPKLSPSGPKNAIKPGPGTAALSAKRAAETRNAVRPGPRLGASNAKNKVVKAPQRSPLDKAKSQARSLSKEVKEKKIKEKLSDLKGKADAMRKKLTAEDKQRAQRAFDKPSVTDKRSRNYMGNLTKEGKGQDPSTGGRKKRNRKPKK